MGFVKTKIKLPRMIEWRSIPERLPIYIFPICLLLIEWILRSTSSLDTKNFIGPTFAAVGVGYVVPLTVTKQRNLPQNIVDVLKQAGLSARPLSEVHFISFCWVFTLIFTALWVWTLFLASKFPDIYWWWFPTSYYPGFVNFLGGFLLSEIREVV